MAIKLDWKRGDKVVPDVYARLTRDTLVTYCAYLFEKGAPMVPAAVPNSPDVAAQASLNSVEAVRRSKAARGASIAEEDGMVRNESGLAALAFYRFANDREAGLDPIGGTRVNLPAGPLLDAVFARMEAGDREGAIAAIYAAAKARMAEDPMLAADFLNLRDA